MYALSEMWLKYRHKWSHGCDKSFSYKDVDNASKEEIDSILSELSDEFDYSEHYRGINYELVEYPPASVIEAEIKAAQNSIEWYNKRVKHLKKIVKFAKAHEVHNS